MINQVAASSILARLDCDEFAEAHRSTAHYDRASFVGLAWRPVGESICCEIYSTGKANLPGSTRTYDLFTSWSRMLPELYRYSDHTERMDMFPDYLVQPHQTCGKRKIWQPAPLASKKIDLWQEDSESQPHGLRGGALVSCTEMDLEELDML